MLLDTVLFPDLINGCGFCCEPRWKTQTLGSLVSTVRSPLTRAAPVQLHGHLLLLLATLAALAACPAAGLAAGSAADLQQWTTYQVPTSQTCLPLADWIPHKALASCHC